MNSGCVGLYRVDGNSGKSQICLIDDTGELKIMNSNIKFYGQGKGNVVNCGIIIYNSKQNKNDDKSASLTCKYPIHGLF